MAAVPWHGEVPMYEEVIIISRMDDRRVEEMYDEYYDAMVVVKRRGFGFVSAVIPETAARCAEC
jgi:hypothetical protein